jgi:hypothetical protein
MKGQVMMSQKTGSWALVVALLVMGSVTIGQESLKDFVEQEGYGWLAGHWKATTDNGDITLTYRWAVNGHALMSSFTMGDRSSQGIIYWVAKEKQMRQFSVDSQGRATKATWEADGRKAVSKTQMMDQDGEARDVGISYTKVDDTTMKVAVHGIENGDLSYDPIFEISFKREKK